MVDLVPASTNLPLSNCTEMTVKKYKMGSSQNHTVNRRDGTNDRPKSLMASERWKVYGAELMDNLGGRRLRPRTQA